MSPPSLLIDLTRKLERLELTVEQLRIALMDERIRRQEAELSKEELRSELTRFLIARHFPTHNH